MLSVRPKGRPYLEIQVHPGDIRRGVRYVFLTLGRLRLGLAAAAVLALFLLANLAIAPRVISGLLLRHEYGAELAQRARHGERLHSLTERMAELGTHVEELRLRMNRVYLAYGLTTDLSEGQGGYPLASRAVPDSIYAGAIRHGTRLETQIEQELRVLETFIDEVQDFEAAHEDQVRTTPSLSPLRGQDFLLTSPFGTRRSPFTKAIDFHTGIDLAAPVGTPIHAPSDGIVVYAGRYPLKLSVAWWRYGNLVAIRHGERFITLYGHCDEIRVRNGQKVKQGDVVGTVGNSGWSTSPHLHYEVRRRQAEDAEFKPVDARIYILDHRWRDEERLLVGARSAPDATGYEPLPRLIGR